MNRCVVVNHNERPGSARTRVQADAFHNPFPDLLKRPFIRKCIASTWSRTFWPIWMKRVWSSLSYFFSWNGGHSLKTLSLLHTERYTFMLACKYLSSKKCSWHLLIKNCLQISSYYYKRYTSTLLLRTLCSTHFLSLTLHNLLLSSIFSKHFSSIPVRQLLVSDRKQH